MDSITIFAVALAIIALIPFLLVFIIYPVLLGYLNKQEKVNARSSHLTYPSVTMVIAARNGERLVADKVKNCLALTYPKDKIDFIFFSDGSTDNTLPLLEELKTDAITVLCDAEHIGKAKALNRACQSATSEVLVFSDLDAILVPNAIELLTQHFADEKVAGVCGQRAIASDTGSLKDAQQKYIKLDSWIKLQESSLGYLTSNDGKLYAVKRQYHNPIAEGVTDDLYSALNIMSQGKQFVFEAQAKAFIKTPSRSANHEINRRRRITCRSLTGIAMFPRLLNPFKSGRFALALISNKIMRRLVPLSLALFFVANILLLPIHPLFTLSFIAQCCFYITAAIAPLIPAQFGKLGKLINAIHYFVLGNYGVLLGVLDFASNKRVTKWEPIKND